MKTNRNLGLSIRALVRTTAAILLVLALAAPPARAQLLVGSAVSGMQYAQEKAYEAFMKIQIVQELEILRQNYTASVNYYNQFKQLNSGRGFMFNISQQFKTAENADLAQMKWQLLDSYNGNTSTDRFVERANEAVYNDMKYMGDEAANIIANKKAAHQLAQNAGNLSPKDAANLSAKSQSLQLQMLLQLHEDNLRLIQLSSIRTLGKNRRQKGELDMIQNIKAGIKRRFPGAPTGGN